MQRSLMPLSFLELPLNLQNNSLSRLVPNLKDVVLYLTTYNSQRSVLDLLLFFYNEQSEVEFGQEPRRSRLWQ